MTTAITCFVIIEQILAQLTGLWTTTFASDFLLSMVPLLLLLATLQQLAADPSIQCSSQGSTC